MILTRALDGCVVLLLYLPEILGLRGWTLTLTQTEICALKGGAVDIICNYRRPSSSDQIQKVVWFTKVDELGQPVDVTEDSENTNRMLNPCTQWKCTLTIRKLKESDSGTYRIRVTTNQANEIYTSENGVSLSVKDPKLEVDINSGWTYNRKRKLNCISSCQLYGHHEYVWYRNGKEISSGRSSSHSGIFDYSDIVSCAIKGYEAFPSPSVCVFGGETCISVTYTQRHICAFTGSSVEIFCSYIVPSSIPAMSKFWFRSRGSGSRPSIDLREDIQYKDRVSFEDNLSENVLKLTDLRESDSGEYRFTLETQQSKLVAALQGTTLTVTGLQVLVTRISGDQSYTIVDLECHSNCRPPGYVSYIWFKNGIKINHISSKIFRYKINLGDKILCAAKTNNVKQLYNALAVYAPNPPSVSLNPSGDILVGDSVSLVCSSDANPAATYHWYKKNFESELKSLSMASELFLPSIQPSDSGDYQCTAENTLGKRTSGYVSINVQYPPKTPSVSVTPSEGIVEGMSVTLACTSDANPAARYTWYKEDQILVQQREGLYNFTSISSEDRGMYYCKPENKHGWSNTSLLIDVLYAPKLPSVSVSPSAEIMEGRSVNLTCSSDANPAATYTWYKENEDSPLSSEQTLNMTDFRPQHSGNYYCEAQNNRGRKNSTLHLVSLASESGQMKAAAASGSVSVLLLALLLLLCAFLVIRRKQSSKITLGERPRNNSQLHEGLEYNIPTSVARWKPVEEQDEVLYSTVIFSRTEEEAVYSNVRSPEANKPTSEEQEEVEYSFVKVPQGSPELKGEDDVEDFSQLYSVINKNYKNTT